MNIIQKSEAIRSILQKSFQDGTSKMARHKCHGYDTDPDGKLVINPDEAAIVSWIFNQYLSGSSFGTIVAGLEKKGIFSPTGKTKWNREALNKLLSNEKYTGRVLLQKTVSTGTTQIKMMASWIGISTPILMRPSFLTRCFKQCSRKNSAVLKIQKTWLL